VSINSRGSAEEGDLTKQFKRRQRPKQPYEEAGLKSVTSGARSAGRRGETSKRVVELESTESKA